MCGIGGILSIGERRVTPEQIERLSCALSHRGPDDFGFLGYSADSGVRCSQSAGVAAGKSIALAHRRLSVIDLSAEARQPLSYSGGRYWIAFNGEIYNYLELRETLMSQGWNFRTSSDTEVILAAYASWGC
jgi:asparagine synthase (glutamine-hydrolysing)